MKYKMTQVPFDQWPEVDRIAWQRLFADGDIFDDTVGQARHWKTATRKANQRNYASWLGWLADKGLLDLAVAPYTRATLETVYAYASDLMEERSKRTVATSLIGLKCVLIRMAPKTDWQWLRNLTNRLDVWAGPATKPYPSPLPADEMVAWTIARLEDLKSRPILTALDCRYYRDALIIAILLFCPLRLNNLTSIEINRHLRRRGTELWICFEGFETKSGRPIAYIVPTVIEPFLAHYLELVRPRFAGAKHSTRLWFAGKRKPLAENTLYQRVVALGLELFGARISPHDYRSIAATFLAKSSPAGSNQAQQLLGHRSRATTQEHYIRASSIESGRLVADAIEAMKIGAKRSRPS
jgi:integrase